VAFTSAPRQLAAAATPLPAPLAEGQCLPIHLFSGEGKGNLWLETRAYRYLCTNT